MKIPFVGMLLVVALQNAFAQDGVRLPYHQMGLNKRQAAAHVLSRFAYSARPGEVDRVAEMRPEVWLAQQLDGALPDEKLNAKLQAFPSVAMSAREIFEIYPKDGQLRRQMKQEGLLDLEKMSQKEIRQKVQAYRQEKGFKPYYQLVNRDLPGQKLYRAVYGENQLVEVLTDFWFNHFNVSIRDGQARTWVLAYERDAIRPHVLGRFRTLLGATAKHPAMLHYLDNAQSQTPNMNRGMGDAPGRKRGINENYARELLELHTLGVDGGYTQEDVINVARALTGWQVFPVGRYAERTEIAMQRRPDRFVREGDFLFRWAVHDRGEKVILGQVFPAGGGMEEGERVLDMLAKHPSTARFISLKLARKFVCDDPSEVLVAQLAQTFLDTDGDLQAVMLTLAKSEAFWAEAKTRTKLKSPFALAAGSLRVLNAEVVNPRPLLQWLNRMGEPLYAYLPPTGYPDFAEAWTNSGTLVTRMNFGIQLASGKIKGVKFRLPSDGQEGSVDAFLKQYAALLLPEQDVTAILAEFAQMVPEHAKRKDVPVVGMILGSPEFQYH